MNSEKFHIASIAVRRQITQSSWDGGAIQVRDDGKQRNIYENQVSDEVLESIDLSAGATI